MATIDWGALVQRIEDDIRENRAPPSASLNPAAFADALARIHASLPAWIGALRDHQGVVTGLADLLAAMSRAGVPHAADAEALVLAVPGLAATVEKWAWVLPMLAGGGPFAPAPTWQPGPRVER
jgi:hypothetical protein